MRVWVCGNPRYCNGRCSNPETNNRCWNCGNRFDDKRIQYPIRWMTLGVSSQ